MGEFRVHHIRFFPYQPLAIHCIDYNEELGRLAVSRSDASIEIWSILDFWYQEKVIPGSESRSVEAVCWLGSRLFSAGLDGNVTEYDLKKLKPKEQTSSNAGPIWCLCKCPTQQLLAAGTEDGCVVIFSTQDGSLMYHQAFDKQEGRILSIAWHPTEDLIVTGGVDNIRIWSVNSGHALQRLTLGRQEKSKETIVWCIAVTSDFTIISGDSRGKTSFWNGKQGTLLRCYQSHKADVLCLAYNEDNSTVYTSGVDSSIVQFEYTPANSESDWKLWVKSNVFHVHTHDVRSLAVVQDKLVSGGVDTNLAVSQTKETKGIKNRRKLSGFPTFSLVKVAPKANIIMFQYANYLEVWKLGHTTKESDKSGDILPLMTKQIKLLQLKTKDSERIVCCAINKTAEYLAYSDQDTVKIYSLSVENQYAMTPKITLKKVKTKFSLSPAHRMQFTHNSSSLVVVTDLAEIQIIHLRDNEAEIVCAIPPLSDEVDSVHLLDVSPDDNLVCIADHSCSILIFNISKQQVHCRLPRYSCQATAVCFNSDGSHLLIAYADQKIYEYNIESEEYTDWCKKHCLKYPKQWLTRHSKIMNIQSHPDDPNKIIFHDEQMLCILDKSQPFPPVDAPVFSSSTWQDQDKIPKNTAFHISSKYKVSESFSFNPVTQAWKNDKIQQLRLPRGSNINTAEPIPSNQLDKPKVTHKIKSDGNCFFSAIAYAITGSQDCQHMVRSLICNHLINNPELKQYLPDDYVNKPVQQYLRDTGMTSDKTWATEAEIFVASDLLRTDIYIYSKFGAQWKWMVHRTGNTDNANSIYLCHTNLNHYDVVISTTDMVQNFPPSLQHYLTDQIKKNQQSEIDKRKKARYHSDSELKKAKCEKSKTYYEKYKENKKETLKMKYRTDKAFRDKIKQKSKARYHGDDNYRHRKTEQEKLQQKEMYKGNDTFKEQKKAKQRDKYNTNELFKVRKKTQEKHKYNTNELSRERKKAHQKHLYTTVKSVREKKKLANRKRYAENIKYKLRKQLCSISKYAKDSIFRNRVKSYAKWKYQEKESFRQAVKDYSFTKYRKDKKFRDQKRSQSSLKYRKNKEFRDQMKSQSSLKYRKDKKFRDRVKSKSSLKYRKDKEFQDRVKSKSSLKYRTFQSFRNFLKASSIKKYSTNPLFRATIKANLKRKYHEDCEIRQIKKKRVKLRRQSIMKAIQTFRRNINDTPDYVCTVCIRILYKNQVKKCKYGRYKVGGQLNQMASTCITGKYVVQCNHSTSTSERRNCAKCNEWICHNCDRYLVQGKMPPQALANNLHLEPIPEVLQKLNNLEKQLIALRIPFMKLLALPRGGQHGVKGPVVNVPSDLDKVTTTLPRTVNDAQMIKVKLKRKLSYKGHYKYEWVNPTNVMEAVKYLIDNNKWYSNVNFNDNWLETSISEDSDIVREDGKENDSEDENEKDQEQNNKTPETIPVETCSQVLDIAQEYLDTSDKIFCLAPAENKVPQNIFKEEGADAMAFPATLPDGRFGLAESRDIKLTPSKYFNSRLFSADKRFASDNQFIFFAQYVTEINHISSNMSIALRKGKQKTDDGQSVTSSMLASSDNLRKILKSDIGFRFLQPVRGTPPYWQRTMKDLYAMIKQLGIPTWFITFSAAETRWDEVTRTLLRQSDDDRNPADIEWTEKCKLIRENPVTCARLFDHRVKALFSDLLLSPSHPVGEVTDYFFRTEFQQRGSPHIHCLIWVKDAPVFDQSSDEEVVKFADKYISCQLPDKEKDPELYDIVSSVQMHSKNHTKTCKKNSNTCRFHFPRPPLKQTFIARSETQDDNESDTEMPDPDNIKEINEYHQRYAKSGKEILKNIWTIISSLDSSENVTIDNVLTSANVTYKQYQDALKAVTNRNIIYHKRNVNDCWVNHYNEHLLRAWKANLDIQYVMDAYSCVAYILSYISKAEAEMGELIQNAKTEAQEGNEDVATTMKRIGHVYVQNREVSAQEAVYRVCSFHLKECSRHVMFVPTGSQPLKMSLPLNLIKARHQNGQDDDNIWMASVIDKYQARPDTDEFNNMCLADFCSKYTYLSPSNRPKSTNKTLPVFQLQGGLGYIKQKAKGKEAVIRYPRFHKQKQSEEYYMSLAQLYLPNRSTVIKPDNIDKYEDFVKTEQVCKIINGNRQWFEINSENLEQAWQDLQDGKMNEDAWGMIAPEAEAERLETELEKQILVDYDPEDIPELNHANEEGQIRKKSNPNVEIVKPKLTEKQIQHLLRNMNKEQAEIFYKIREWCLKFALGQHPEPFHLFLTGGAGTGKTHVIKCVYHEATRILSKSIENPDSEAVVLTAPTGTAAFNVGGPTIHSAFGISKNTKLPYVPMGENILNTLRSKFENLQILVIDEVSMVDHKLLTYIHGRLCQLKQSKRYFGNISVLAVGDFRQLPPVRASPLYKIKDSNFNDLWNGVFSIATLTEIMRQKEDIAFAEMLNRLRIHIKGQPLNENDISILSSVSFEQTPDDSKHVLHVFATNKEVNQHNDKMIEDICNPIVNSIAKDFYKNLVTGQTCKKDTPFSTTCNEDLPTTLKLGIGARVMLSRNIDTEDGLVNGAFGTIVAMDTLLNADISAIYIKFDDSKCGKKYLSTSVITNESSKNAVRILPFEDNIQGRNATRKQFPIKLGWAATIHKTQGMTVKNIVVSLKSIFQPGMAYVALSRATSLSGLKIINFDTNVIYASEDISKSLEKMPQFLPENMVTTEISNTVSIFLHNTEGLIPHLQDIKRNKKLVNSEIICLTETWTNNNTTLPVSFLPSHKIYMLSRSQAYSNTDPVYKDLSAMDRGGVSMFIKKNISQTRLNFNQIRNFEFITCQISTPVQFTIVTVYRPPQYSFKLFIQNLKPLVEELHNQQNPSIFIGDFNDDLLKNKTTIDNIFSNFGFKQLVKSATTEAGSCLDLVFVKGFSKDPIVNVIPLYYSFHEGISITIPY